ncbi:hypothetical protein D3C77_397000 [compost metagenome]
MQRRLIIHENFCHFTLAVQCIADCRILIAGVLSQVRIAEFLGSLGSALHHFLNVDACRSNWQKAYSCKYGITSADVVRNNKALVAFLRGELLKSAFLAVGCSVNAFTSFFLAVFLLKRCTENAECNRRLRRSTRFGNDVNREILAFNQV